MTDANKQYKIRSLRSKIDYAMRKVKENETALEGLTDLIEKEMIRGLRNNSYRLSLARLVLRMSESRVAKDTYKIDVSKEAVRLSEQAVKMMREIDELRDDMWGWSEEIKELKGDVLND
mgnify:CR=1 FL=1